MTNEAYNVLVPVDFSNVSRLAIAKAVELVNTFNGNIHLVHIVPVHGLPLIDPQTGTVLAYSCTVDMEYAGKKLKQLKDYYQNHICSGNKIEISVLHGNVQEKLREYISRYEMDLIIKGLSRFNLLQRISSTVSINNLVRKTNIPVLTVHSSGLICHFNKIVLPLHDDIPINRIRLAATLGRHFKSTLYVLSVRDDARHHVQLLHQTLEVIKSITAIPVQSIILEGKSLAKATLEFSKKINADLIMVNSKSEFCLPGLWNRITDNLLSYTSKIHVLTVHQNE
jgi:nucleotide-binding universal stress UspA family protein